MSTLTIQSTTVSEMLAGAGISVIVIVGLIHLIDAPGDLQEAPYQGLLFLATFFGALMAAIGIYRRHRSHSVKEARTVRASSSSSEERRALSI